MSTKTRTGVIVWLRTTVLLGGVARDIVMAHPSFPTSDLFGKVTAVTVEVVDDQD